MEPGGAPKGLKPPNGAQMEPKWRSNGAHAQMEPNGAPLGPGGSGTVERVVIKTRCIIINKYNNIYIIYNIYIYYIIFISH